MPFGSTAVSNIHDGTAESGKGELTEVANVTFLADASDWVRVMTGQLDGRAAYMQGKLKNQGRRGAGNEIADTLQDSS